MLYLCVIPDKYVCVVVTYGGLTIGVKIPLDSPFVICVVIYCGPLAHVRRNSYAYSVVVVRLFLFVIEYFVYGELLGVFEHVVGRRG